MVLGMAEQESKSALVEFAELDDLTDLKRLREIQNKAWRAERFGSWLNELITKGREALEVLNGRAEK